MRKELNLHGNSSPFVVSLSSLFVSADLGANKKFGYDIFLITNDSGIRYRILNLSFGCYVVGVEFIKSRSFLG